MIKYKASTYGNKIEAIEIEKQTEKTVTDKNGRRHNITGTYESWFDNWDQAKQYLVKNVEHDVEVARRHLEYYNGKLGNVKGMKQK